MLLFLLLGAAGVWFVPRLWAVEIRPLIWKSTARMILDRPLTGHGIGTFALAYPRFRLSEYFAHPKAANLTEHAHNELLEVAAEQGIPGLISLLAVWGVAIYYGIKSVAVADNPISRRLLAGILAAALIFMLHGLIDVDLQFLPNQLLLWLVIGILIGAAQLPEVRLVKLSLPARCLGAGICFTLAGVVTVSLLVPGVTADILDRQARVAEARGDLSTAQALATRCLEIQPLRLKTRHFLIEVLSRSQDTEQLALQEAHKLATLAPDYAEISFNIGLLYLAQRNPRAARPYLERAIAINPYNSRAHSSLGFALGELGHWAAACIQLKAALLLDSKNVDAATLLALYQSRRSQ